jgi:hypothetical protein
MTSEARRRACLAASLAVAWNGLGEIAWAQPTQGGTAYTRVSWFHTLAMARLTFWSNGTPDFIYELGQLPSGDNFRSVPLGSGGSTSGTYIFLGVGAGTGDVFISFSDPAFGVGKSFESLFPGMSEPQVADAILAGGSSFESFLPNLPRVQGARTPIGNGSAGVHFSDGEFSGASIASFTPVPEPADALVCLGAAGGCGLLIRRRQVVDAGAAAAR